MLSVSGLSTGFSGKLLFEGLTFQVKSKDRFGLIGKNGAGKSTLLKIIAGEQEYEKGGIVFQPGITIGYLPQEIKIEGNRTVVDEAKQAFKELLDLDAKIKDIEVALTVRTDYESDSYMQLIHDLNDFHERLALFDATEIDSKTERILKGLGFDQTDFDRNLSEYSGGWQMRVVLTKILLTMPDLILLDEPTNHLDIESILWLEEFFINYPGSLLMVSHDKMFLDNVTNKTLEIVNGKSYDYKAPYSKFLQLRQERIELQTSAKKNQDQFIKQQERFIERFRSKSTKSKQVQSKLKQLDKVERIAIDDVETSEINLRFPPAPRSGDKALKVEDVAKYYDDKKVFENLNFEVLRGEKVAFVGKNGMGKTTLVKIINGMKTTKGELTLGHNVEMGYYAQVQEKTLNPGDTIFETLDNIATDEWRNVSKLRGLLGAFLFTEEEVDKKVRVLSGGEKSRLAIAKLLLKAYNLLVLDEPTNHLDIASKEILKNALKQYNGTLIIVSHDRDFLQGLTDKTYEFIDGTVREHLGSIDEFLTKHETESFRDFEQEKKVEKAKVVEEKPTSKSKVNYQEKKDSEKASRVIRKDIIKAEKKIERVENDIANLEKQLQDPAVMTNQTQSAELILRHSELQKDLDMHMARWEKLESDLTEISK